MKLLRGWGASFLWVAAWLVVPASEANAGVVNIGTIVVDKYEAVPDDGGTGGVDIILHYELNGNMERFKDCFDKSNLFWLQRVTSSGPTGFTPDPNRPFIDPRKDQPGGFDTLPWYDATFKSLADATANTDRNFGPGPYLLDTPRVLLTRGPYSFTAETLLVVEKDKMISILGGVKWGFTIGADKTTVTKLPLTEITDLAKAKADFNTALEKDFPDYKIKEFEEIWPEISRQGTPRVSLAPEPGTLVLALVSIVGIVPLARSQRNRRAA